MGDDGVLDVEDLDPNRPGKQLHLYDGQAIARLSPKTEIGKVTVADTCNSRKAEGAVTFGTVLSPLILVGVANAQIGYLSTSSPQPTALDLEEQFEDGLYSDERLAFYLEGSIFSRYMVTGSYDSNLRFQDRLFRDLQPDKLYPIYGDSSSVFFDAQSSSKGYLRLERDRSYLLLGDYETNLSTNELSSQHRSFNGVKLNLEDTNYKLATVASQTNRQVIRDELPGLGISSYYFLTESPIVQGSEKVRIEVRDLYHSERILRSEIRHRYNDYDIDYAQGSLFFKQPVPTRDADYNPIWIVVIYEAISDAKKDYAIAVHGEIGWGQQIRLGGTVVDENAQDGGSQLLGSNLAVCLIPRTTVIGEYSRSEFENKTDDVWKVNLNSSPVSALQLNGYYQNIGDAFVNLSSHTAELDLESMA